MILIKLILPNNIKLITLLQSPCNLTPSKQTLSSIKLWATHSKRPTKRLQKPAQSKWVQSTSITNGSYG